jgi:cyclic pyranopterin monophosphate synthase
MNQLTHLDDAGNARMVDVSGKQVSIRAATAATFVRCPTGGVALLRSGGVPKGDVLAVARIAGIAAAKRTPELLPLAHVIGVHGVEVEALTSASVAALAVVDMVKGVDRTVEIENVRLLAKDGGRSGSWRRDA